MKLFVHQQLFDVCVLRKANEKVMDMLAEEQPDMFLLSNLCVQHGTALILAPVATAYQLATSAFLTAKRFNMDKSRTALFDAIYDILSENMIYTEALLHGYMPKCHVGARQYNRALLELTYLNGHQARRMSPHV
eukprot:3712381-Amphidinium_carterae.2